MFMTIQMVMNLLQVQKMEEFPSLVNISLMGSQKWHSHSED